MLGINSAAGRARTHIRAFAWPLRAASNSDGAAIQPVLTFIVRRNDAAVYRLAARRAVNVAEIGTRIEYGIAHPAGNKNECENAEPDPS